MQAQLTDGTIVELAKDCDCLDSIHVGPHWLHADELERYLNGEIISMAEQATEAGNYDSAWLLYNRHAQVELVRLEAKGREMKRRGIERLL